MHKHFENMYYLGKLAFGTCLGWIWAFNPDPYIKLLAGLASLTTIGAGISTMIKNRRK